MSAPGDLGVSGVGQGVRRDVAALDQCDPQAPPFQLDGAEDAYDAGADDRYIKRLGARVRHIRLVYEHGRSNRFTFGRGGRAILRPIGPCLGNLRDRIYAAKSAREGALGLTVPPSAA